AVDVGVVLAVAGGLIMLVPVIDLVRFAAARPKEEVDVIQEKGGPIEERVVCGENASAANEQVTGRVGSATLALGVTGADGRFSVDLEKLVTPAWRHALGDPSRMQIWVGSEQV